MEENRLVEILWSVRDATERDIHQNTVTAVLDTTTGKRRLRIVNPVVLLECKGTNLAEIDQTNRKDERQLHVLATCLPEFIAEAGKGAAREQVMLLDRLLDFGTSAIGMHLRKEHQIDIASLVARCVSYLSPDHPTGPASRFVAERFPRWIAHLKVKDERTSISMPYPVVSVLSG